MSLFFILFSLFSSLALLSAVLVIISKNPVYSALFLILSFCNASALLFLLKLEFLPITFLVVYVGAIAVLFLFVIMMLNIKISEIKKQSMHLLPVIILLVCIFAVEVSLMTRIEFSSLSFTFIHSDFFIDKSNISLSFIDSTVASLNDHNLRSLGQILFTEYWIQFIIVGYVLLLAMIGTITLTLQKKFISKTQNTYFQVIRETNLCLASYN